MTVSSVRAALKTTLETISGLNVYGEVPDSISKFPTAIIDNQSVDYQQAMGGGSALIGTRVLLLIGDRDSQTAYTTLDGYLAVTGSTSVPAAIRAATGITKPFVRRAENVGFINYRGQTFIGAEFIVDVFD